MSGVSNIETKAEQAVVLYLQLDADLSEINIQGGVESANLKTPYIVANCTGAEEHIYGTGQYAVTLDLEIKSIVDDTFPEVHMATVAAVRDQFANDWSAISLSTMVPAFTVVGVIMEPSSQKIDGRGWQTNIPVLLHCRPSSP
jgi:hypothetical protein